MIAAQINNAGLMPTADQRRIPMEPIFRLALWWFGPQPAQLAVAEIDPVHFTLLTLRVKHVAILWIEHDVKPVAASERRPIGITNSFFARHSAGSHPILVILKSARDAVGWFRVV